MRILVVEDDKDVAGFVVKGLKEAGHVVEHADNGRDGLFLAASENFDAIVLDRMLPGGVDGLRLLETLRAQGNQTPVLFLSAMAQVDDRVRGPQGRRRRLHDQAVRLLRAARPGGGADPPRQDRGAGRPS